jgi:ubiquinone/menaquinone biosynthesis C-methylase UbiE
MRQWLDLVAAHVPFSPQLIVDVGCGTGRFSQPLADRFAAKVVAIDPSQRMLAVARTKPTNGRVEFKLAPAERLPLADRSAGLVFMSMVLHHLPDKGAVARECCRILRAGGRFCMRTCTRDIVYPQSRHGERVSSRDLQRHPDREALLAAMAYVPRVPNLLFHIDPPPKC